MACSVLSLEDRTTNSLSDCVTCSQLIADPLSGMSKAGMMADKNLYVIIICDNYIFFTGHPGMPMRGMTPPGRMPGPMNPAVSDFNVC